MRGRVTVKGPMNAVGVVVDLEVVQFAREIDRVPEERAIMILTSDRSDQSFDERMGDRVYGTDCSSSISSTRKLASQR